MSCSVEGCERAPQKVGMCNMHYLRKWKSGEVGGPGARRPAVLGELIACSSCGTQFARWNAGKRCKPCRAAEQAAWGHQNREKVAANARNYLARRKSARLDAKISKHERAAIVAHARICCACLDPAEELDHYIPLSRGGPDALDNLIPLCKSCNASKNDKLPIWEWVGR